MVCQLYDLWYRENCINMLSDQNAAMNWRAKSRKYQGVIRGEKSSKDMGKFEEFGLNNWSISKSQMGDGTRCPEG